MPIMERIVKPKTHKGKKVLLSREPKLIEDTKMTMFIKGNKTTEVTRNCLKDLYTLKKPDATFLAQKNDIHPFDDITPIEKFGKKFNASLFLFISNNKKRPDNLIIGRLFEHTIMDMVEFGIENYKSMLAFKGEKIVDGIKPMLVFQGELFDSNSEFVRIRNLMIDLFQREPVQQIRLQGLEHVLSFTAQDNCILVRSYKSLLKKSGTRLPKIDLVEIGPRFDLRIRRTKLATDDLFKQACKRPKEIKEKKKKNISDDNLGSTLGRIHMGAQNLNKIQTRKMKGLKKTTSEKKLERKRKNSSGEFEVTKVPRVAAEEKEN